jgi:hypothetical protein
MKMLLTKERETLSKLQTTIYLKIDDVTSETPIEAG